MDTLAILVREKDIVNVKNALKNRIMQADLVGALEQLERSWRAFEHKGKPMTQDQVKRVLVYGIQKGYKSTGQLTDEEVDSVINKMV